MALPQPLRRIRAAQCFATVIGTPYHRLRFQQGELVGNLRDREVANAFVRGTFADYGYFDLARVLLAAGDVHVDLGANYGFHTFGLAGSPHGSTVRYILIDANPDCIACLAESVKLHPELRCQAFHTAAAEKAGEIQFTFAPSVTGGGHIGRAGNSGGVELTVQSTALDDLFAAQGIDRVKLMKVDIEGSEPVAMRGLSGMLASHRIDFIYFEVNPGCLELQKSSPPDLFAEFTRHGYRLFWPHDGVDWISRTFGGAHLQRSELKRFFIPGQQPYAVAEFEQGLYRAGRFGQCDLLAISPQCQLEEAPSSG